MAGKRPKILIVDDQETNRMVLEGCLANEDFELEMAVDGVDALEKIFQAPPTMILCDVMMPNADGYEVCRRVRANPDTAVIPIVLITALRGTQERIKGIESGADDFISKPFDSHEVRARVHQLVRYDHLRNMVAERERFDAVMDGALVGILTLDETLGIHSANQPACAYLGIDEPARQGIGPALKKNFDLDSAIEDVIGGDELEASRFELERRDSAGPPLILECRLTPSHDQGGDLTGAVIILRDVTEERRQQKMKNRFLELITHKLQTPLIGIIGVVDLMSGGDLEEDELEEMVEVLDERSKSLHTLVQQLLDFVNTSGALTPANDASCPADAGLDDVAAAVDSAHPERKLALVRDFDAAPQVALSQEHLELVFRHLLDNAVKFGNSDTANVSVSVKQMDGHVQIAVQDDGPGIPPEEHERIFESFHQAEATFTGNVEGAGLGLSLVRQVARMYGGDVAVESQNGDGSRFTVDLPQAA